MIETEIKKLVIPTSTYITSIGDRLYIANLPDTVTYPCAALFAISSVEMPEGKVFTDRIQFSCFADSLSVASEISDSICNRLKSFKGLPSSASTYTIMSSYPEYNSYMYDSENLKHIKHLDMIIMYRR